MPSLSKYGAASGASKKFSRRLASASKFGSLAQTAKETGVRSKQAIADTLESIQKIAGTVGEVRKEIQYGKDVEDIARGAYGIETKTEKGFLGIPKTTYTEKDTGKALSAMDVYAYGKYGEGTPTYDKWFGEDAQRERGMKEIDEIRKANVAASAESYEGRKEKFDTMQQQNKELLERQSKIVVSEEAVSETPVVEEIISDDSAYVTRGAKPDVLEGGAVREEKSSWPYDYTPKELERIKQGRVESTRPVKGTIDPNYQDFIIKPSQQESLLTPGRKETQEFEAIPMNVAEPLTTDVFMQDEGISPPGEAISQMQSPDHNLFGAEETAFSSGDIERIIGAESSGLPGAVSSTGRIGAMQIWESTAADPGYGVTPVGRDALEDPQSNIAFGKEYLEAMYKRFGSKEKALAAYLLGPGAAQRDYFPQMGAADPETRVRKHLRGKVLDPKKPKPETFGSVQLYIDRILGKSPLHKSYGDEEAILSNVRQRYGGMY